MLDMELDMDRDSEALSSASGADQSADQSEMDSSVCGRPQGAAPTLWEMEGFSVPKHGLEEDENEDAYAYNPQDGWLAVADGATEASYARLWARILVEELAPVSLAPPGSLAGVFPSSKEELKERLKLLLPQFQQSWHKRVPWEQLQDKGWLFAVKAGQGAFATLLGVRLDGLTWRAFNVGDSHLFIITEDDYIKSSFPDVQAEEFGFSPCLIPSLPGPGVEKALASLDWKAGEMTLTDRLLICTDAVAAYLLKEGEGEKKRSAGCKPLVKSSPAWQELLKVESPEGFRDWVKQARLKSLHNDDSTVVLVKPGGRVR